MDPIPDPKLPAISTRFLNNTKYFLHAQKEMAEAAYNNQGSSAASSRVVSHR